MLWALAIKKKLLNSFQINKVKVSLKKSLYLGYNNTFSSVFQHKSSLNSEARMVQKVTFTINPPARKIYHLYSYSTVSQLVKNVSL